MGLGNWIETGKWNVQAPTPPASGPKPKLEGLFSTHGDAPRGRARTASLAFRHLATLPGAQPSGDGADVGTTDDIGEGDMVPIKPAYGSFDVGIPDIQLSWYVSQGFIGYQMCALLSQHWLIEKACTMPAKDAIRKGYDISIKGESKPDPDIIDYLREQDVAMRLNDKLIEFIRMGRVFGLRLALFVVDSDDPDYYIKPFNIDGVLPYAYKGISQIDPYWTSPQLSRNEARSPGSLHFYEPEFWTVRDKVIHRSHFVIFTTGQVPDVLKPAYNFGGVSVPQRIYERVYAAERTANEAPLLAMSKRLTVLKTDLDFTLLDETTFEARMAWWTQTRDNFGVKINATGDEIEQFDTALGDMDNLIMTQYQIVAAIAGVPGTKLLGTQPKGFNSTGEFEESSYHEELESIQANDLTPLLNRHYALMVKSRVLPKFGTGNGSGKMKINVNWNELDAMTALQQAQLNLVKVEGDAAVLSTGAIEAQDVRTRLINDADSGYADLSPTVPPMPQTVAGANPLDPLTPPKPKMPIAKVPAGA